MRLIYSIIFTCSFLLSQAAEYTFERISTQDGLSQNSVECIFQDSYGYIWIGTNDDLCRYDGYDFKTYLVKKGTENSITSNLVKHITEDQHKNLWIATVDGGVSVLIKPIKPESLYSLCFKYLVYR